VALHPEQNENQTPESPEAGEPTQNSRETQTPIRQEQRLHLPQETS